MTWIHEKEGDSLIRTCDICQLSQIKCSDGEWAIYLTYKRVEACIIFMMAGIEETCVHTPDEDSK